MTPNRIFRTKLAIATVLLAAAGWIAWATVHHFRRSADPIRIADNFAKFARNSPRNISVLSPTAQAETFDEIFRAPALDLPAALTEIRRRHCRHSERPVLPHGLARLSKKTILSHADRTIAEGWTIGKRPPFSLETPIDWAADPHHDTSWRMWLNCWQPLDRLLQAYDQTHDDRYLDFANRVALDWIDQHVFAARENPLAWYDMAIGRRAALLGKLIDANLHNDRLDDQRLVDLFIAARLHGLKLIIPEQITWATNHGFYQLVGLAALAKAAPELNGAAEFGEFAQTGLSKLLHEHLTDEGINCEH